MIIFLKYDHSTLYQVLSQFHITSRNAHPTIGDSQRLNNNDRASLLWIWGVKLEEVCSPAQQQPLYYPDTPRLK